MDGISLDKRLMDSTDHMEVNGVSSELESLAYIVKLTVFDDTNTGFITWGVDHDMGTVSVVS